MKKYIMCAARNLIMNLHNPWGKTGLDAINWEPVLTAFLGAYGFTIADMQAYAREQLFIHKIDDICHF